MRRKRDLASSSCASPLDAPHADVDNVEPTLTASEPPPQDNKVDIRRRYGKHRQSPWTTCRAVYNLLNLNHVPIQINYESKPMIMSRFIDYMINYPVDLLSTLLMLSKPETL